MVWVVKAVTKSVTYCMVWLVWAVKKSVTAVDRRGLHGVSGKGCYKECDILHGVSGKGLWHIAWCDWYGLLQRVWQLLTGCGCMVWLVWAVTKSVTAVDRRGLYGVIGMGCYKECDNCWQEGAVWCDWYGLLQRVWQLLTGGGLHDVIGMGCYKECDSCWQEGAVWCDWYGLLQRVWQLLTGGGCMVWVVKAVTKSVTYCMVWVVKACDVLHGVIGMDVTKSVTTVNRRGLWSELEELVRQKANVNAVDGQSQATVLHIMASQRQPASKPDKKHVHFTLGGGGGGGGCRYSGWEM